MGRDVPRKLVTPGAIRPRHEIEIIGLGRLERGAQGGRSGIGDRTWRQARMLIGVVSVRARQVGLMNGPAITAFEQGGVHGGGVAVELHPNLQPVAEHRRDKGPVGRYRGLLFDERRQRDRLVDIGGRAQALPFGAEALRENAAKLRGAGVAGEAVGVGEEIAFEGGSRRRKVMNNRRIARGGKKLRRGHPSQILHRGGDIEHVLPFRNRQLVIKNITPRDAAVYLDRRSRPGESVLARLQLQRRMDGAQRQ